MKFTAWQIDMLRRGLQSYRVKEAANGRLPPWKTVHLYILLSDATVSVFPEDGSEPDFKEEALRRFANGGSVLGLDKLEDVRRFLMHEGVLSEEELAEGSGDAAELSALHRYLANDSDSSRRVLERLALDYKAGDEPGHVAEQINLSFMLDPSGTFVRVEERYRRNLQNRDPFGTLAGKQKAVLSNPEGPDPYLGESALAFDPAGLVAEEGKRAVWNPQEHDPYPGDPVAFDPSGMLAGDDDLENHDPLHNDRQAETVVFDSIRRGYGFVSTPLDILHVFLRGNSATDRIHYIQVAGAGDWTQVVLMRVGAYRAGRNVARARRELTVQDCGIYRFLPVDAPWSS